MSLDIGKYVNPSLEIITCSAFIFIKDKYIKFCLRDEVSLEFQNSMDYFHTKNNNFGRYSFA